MHLRAHLIGGNSNAPVEDVCAIGRRKIKIREFHDDLWALNSSSALATAAALNVRTARITPVSRARLVVEVCVFMESPVVATH
jgi:hypothetical protein